MRVLITAGWLGGAGGAERLLYSVLQALEDDDVDLVVRHELGGPWAVTPPRTTVVPISNWRWRGATNTVRYKDRIARHLVNPIRRQLVPRYDLHLGFRHGGDLASASRARLRLYLPCGNELEGLPRGYDRVALESPDNERLVPEGCPTVLLPPPLQAISDVVEPVTSAPADFFLTVFNPYSPIKGMEDLASAADTAPLPIVWCHSNQTLKSVPDPHLASHPNIIHVDDPSLAQLRFLYETCRAYLSFSRSEGFGWAAADGLQHSSSVVSRPIGVLSFPQSQQEEGVHIVGETWQIDWSILMASAGSPVPRDLTWLSPVEFRSMLGDLVAERLG